MTKTSPLVRKAGPLPVWGWAALALVAGYVYLHRASAQGAQLPYTPAGSGAQQPASGQGTPADNGNSSLLDALGSNLASQDALLAALQAGGQSGYGGAGGGESGSGTATTATTAPTVVGAGVPTDPPPAEPLVNQYAAYVAANPAPTPPDLVNQYTPSEATPGVLSGYLAYKSTLPVTGPTPIVVQPAPVDTSGVVSTQSTPIPKGKAIAE